MVSTTEKMCDDLDAINIKELSRKAMKGKWVEVIERYRVNPSAQMAKITRSRDTALHIAVSDSGEKEVVKELVDTISRQPDGKEALKLGDERGNTPLHLAASMGSLTMCRCIAEADPSLWVFLMRTKRLPFSWQQPMVEKDALLYLHHICSQQKLNGYHYSRRKDGDNILHCAISRDYFGEFYI